MNRNMNVTGRDPYIVAKGLAYGYVIINAMPEKRQEWSDGEDMLLLLTALVGETQRDHMLRTARCHLGLEPLFLDEEFEAESRREMIENLAHLLGVKVTVLS